jgi:hypothetical protein
MFGENPVMSPEFAASDEAAMSVSGTTCPLWQGVAATYADAQSGILEFVEVT